VGPRQRKRETQPLWFAPLFSRKLDLKKSCHEVAGAQRPLREKRVFRQKAATSWQLPRAEGSWQLFLVFWPIFCARWILSYILGLFILTISKIGPRFKKFS
jgi:hypothetical protein